MSILDEGEKPRLFGAFDLFILMLKRTKHI